MDFLSQLVGSFSIGSNGNPTVEIVEAAFAHHHLPYRYINCEVRPADLKAAVEGAKAMGWVGFNLSIPHKVEVIKYLDGVGDSAALIGAVNCVVLRDGKFIGENTDGKGFLASLKTMTDPSEKSILIFGAGGAARAIAIELALAGARLITIVNRDISRGQELVALVNEKTSSRAEFSEWSGTYQIAGDTDVVVNATSIGMSPLDDQQLDFDPTTLLATMVVADVVVNPPETLFIKSAQFSGCRVLNGSGMIVNQAVLCIKYWTGVDVSADVLHQRLRELQ